MDELRVELAEVNAKVMKDNVQEKRGEEVKPTSSERNSVLALYCSVTDVVLSLC